MKKRTFKEWAIIAAYSVPALGVVVVNAITSLVTHFIETMELFIAMHTHKKSLPQRPDPESDGVAELGPESKPEPESELEEADLEALAREAGGRMQAAGAEITFSAALYLNESNGQPSVAYHAAASREGAEGLGLVVEGSLDDDAALPPLATMTALQGLFPLYLARGADMEQTRDAIIELCRQIAEGKGEAAGSKSTSAENADPILH